MEVNRIFETDHLFYLTDQNIIFSKTTAENSPELLQLFQFVAEKASGGRMRPESLEQLLTDPMTLKRRIKVHNHLTETFLLKYLKIVAEEGLLTITCDHKHIGNTQGDLEKKMFGIEVIMTKKIGNKREKVGILLEYIPVNDGTLITTVALLTSFLEDWDLWGK